MYRRKFFFGKHKGEFILDVIECDTQYISWCLKYVDFLKFNDMEMQVYNDKLKATDAYDINAIPREMTNVGNT